jgi:DNA-binding SARP family transcriptional activator/KaiC/GvpD/RAD55 family RecA-like ATPase
MLKILVLGPPAIFNDDKPLKIQRRQARILLYYLACQPDGVSRGDIISRLWKDSSETDARRSLREILSKLRNEIPDADAICSDQDRIWLDSEKSYSDYFHFLNLIQPAHSFFGLTHRQNILPDNVVTKLEQAVSIWRAPFFLAGMGIRSTYAFDDWFQSKTSSLEYYLLQSLERLADHFSNSGDLDKAIIYLNRALESDPLDEHLQEYLLGLYYKAGRFNEAQVYYKFIKDLYQRELEEVPPGILQLAIKDTTQSPTVDTRKNRPSGMTWGSTASEFIGRANELEKMEKYYIDSGVVFVLGEVGSGKSLFVHYFCSLLKAKQRTLYVTCHEDEVNQPFQPFINLIRNHFKQEDFERLDDFSQNTLSLILPGFKPKNKTTTLLEDVPLETSRESLFEAIYLLLKKNLRGGRAIIVFENIQWIDSDSIDVLMYLSKAGFYRDNAFLILTSRIEMDNLKARFLIREDDRHKFIPRIDIKPFILQETGTMARKILGKEPDQAFIKRLQTATGGNPLLIRETLTSILEAEEDPSSLDPNKIQISEKLTSIIEEKEEMLDSLSKEILGAAAVCGMEFQYDILEFLDICPNKDLVRILEELESKQFIHSLTGSEGTGRYSFNHSFFRDSLLTHLSHARLYYLNEQIARAKIKLRGNQSRRQASVIARHFEMGGKPLEAFKYWVKAAQSACELFSREEANFAFSRANQIRLEFGELISEDDLYALFSDWGDMAYNLMDLPSLSECYTNMYEAGLQINSNLLIGVGLSGMGLSNFYKSEIERALVFLEEGLEIIDKTDNQLEKIRCRFWFAMTLSTAGFNVRAIEILNEANKLGETLNNQKIREIVTLVQDFSSLLCSTLGMLSQAIEYGKAALRNSYLLVSKHSAHSGAFTTLAIAEYYSGRFSESMKYINQSKKIILTHRNPRILAYISIIESRLNTLQARLDSGWDLAITAMQLATDNKYIEIISSAYCLRGDVFLTLHMYDKAINEYQLGFDIMPGTHSGFDNYYRLGYATAMNGDLEAGLQILKSAIEQAEKIQLGSIFIPARYLYAQVLETNERVDESKAIYEYVIDEAQSRGFSLITIPGSLPRLRYLWDTLDNSLAEQVISSLYSKGVIQPGEWIERLIANVKKNRLYSEKFDDEKFFNFLRSAITNQ